MGRVKTRQGTRTCRAAPRCAAPSLSGRTPSKLQPRPGRPCAPCRVHCSTKAQRPSTPPAGPRHARAASMPGRPCPPAPGPRTPWQPPGQGALSPPSHSSSFILSFKNRSRKSSASPLAPLEPPRSPRKVMSARGWEVRGSSPPSAPAANSCGCGGGGGGRGRGEGLWAAPEGVVRAGDGRSSSMYWGRERAALL